MNFQDEALNLFMNQPYTGMLLVFVLTSAVFLTVKFRFVQLTKLLQAFRFMSTSQGKGKISTFSAMAAVLGGNLGTGNIAGVAVALKLGGPGSIFWMWVMTIFMSIFKYVGVHLGVQYRKKSSNDGYAGGPMYYLRDGAKQPLIAKIFAVSMIGLALTGGNLVQVNSLALPAEQVGIPPLVIGILLAVLVAIVKPGGIQRFSSVISSTVPFMACAYLLICLVIVVAGWGQLYGISMLIFDSAFNLSSATGGLTGFGVLTALHIGFDRTLFATECGVGLAPIIHAPVTSDKDVDKNAEIQALVSLLSPFIVMIICTLTAYVLLLSGLWQVSGLESTNLCLAAFKKGFDSNYIVYLITATMFLFGFTTMLTWSFCADRSVAFLWGEKYIKYYQIIYVLIVPLGSVLSVSFVWQVADYVLETLILLNLVGVMKLYKIVLKKTFPMKYS